MGILLIIKGPPQAAIAAAGEHGVATLHLVRQDETRNTTTALTEDHYQAEVGVWYCEDLDMAAPFAVGSLLFYRHDAII